ncbi:MAG TPA: OmpH family outer membrane protein [Planctomycetaceae bacterium]|nr:OmpH family outer membrane protein [Planctomycetaceae bacterium]
MRKLLIFSAVVASLASFLVTAFGQNPSTAGSRPKATVTPAAAQAEAPHKIGLIDMGRVFKEYKKVEALREDWKAELQTNEESAKQMAGKVQGIIEQMKQFKPASTEFVKLEKQQTQLTAEFESFRKNSQRTLMQKEADMFKTVYLEAMEVVEKFAKVYHYTLVMRFNSENIEGEDLQKLQIGLNRIIVYHQTEDDLTDGVIGHLNKLYEKKSGGSTGAGSGSSAPREPRDARKPGNSQN